MASSLERRTPRVLDPASWSRREAFELFRSFAFPYVNVTADVDVTRLREAHRAAGITFTVAVVHVLCAAANAVPAFRRRLRGAEAVEYDVVDPSITVLGEGDVFRFATLRFDPDVRQFAADAAHRIERAKQSPRLWSEEDRDDLLYMTAMPWVAFTGLVHPVPLDPPDSVPRIAWGRRREANGRVLLPLNVQAHHALVDGIDVGRFFAEAEDRAGGTFG
ncbi:MAG: chloramphenicol acetyltransferase [Candidatus Bipolaricaulota bacterium]